MTPTVTVTVGSRRFEINEGELFTFGRSKKVTACLDRADLGISRIAGSIEHENGTWWLINRSEIRPLEVIDDVGMRTVLPPTRRLAITTPVTVVVEGEAHRHALAIDTTGSEDDSLDLLSVTDENPTSTAIGVTITHADKLALVALFAGYLEPFPRYDPHPRSYADAAARLDWPRTTLIKRVEYLRTRLTNAGVPNLLGENALQHLAEWALATGKITREDLKLLPER